MTREEAYKSAASPPATAAGAAPGRRGLKSKFTAALLAGVAAFGLLALAAAWHQMTGVLRSELERRALEIAANLGDGAAPMIQRGAILDLYALATKYSLLPGVAYTLVRDARGAVLAHSPEAPPAAFHAAPPPGGLSRPLGRQFDLQGRAVYEAGAAILDGQAGSISVAVWVDSVDAWALRAAVSLAGLLIGALLIGAVLTLFLTRRIFRRALRLREAAERVSLGDLETAIGIESNDEIGDIANSLERMRASLKAAITRLNRT